MSSIAILGASRGLGRALVDQIREVEPTAKLLLVSRTVTRAFADARDGGLLLADLDFSKLDNLPRLAQILQDFSPTEIFYVAGGGPFGEFSSKDWKDHAWAINVNFLFPAELLHRTLSPEGRAAMPKLKRFVAVGSAIAGEKPDPMAASYSAAKHGLHGLFASARLENPTVDLRVYAPGYIDTGLLPKAAWPRQVPGMVASPQDEARKLWQWSRSSVD